MKKMLALVALAALAATACSKQETAATGAAAADPKVPGPHGAADPGIEAMTQSAASPVEAGILYELPAGWTRVPPSGKLRMDQASVAGPAGEAELAVFFFGTGGGGGVDANLDMWAELVEGGTPTRGAFEQGGYKVSTVEAAGRVLPSGMNNSSKTIDKGRLIGAVVEGPGGPWYFKLTGPDATVAAQKEAFLAMLRAVRANPKGAKAESL